MKDLTPIRGQTFLAKAIAQGENHTQDFKYAISDAHKIARSISAFANNAGGRLLIGVRDNGTIAGIRTDEDIYLVEQAALMYCHPAQHLTFQAYRLPSTGAVVVSAEVPQAPRRGVECIEADGTRRAYFRIHDENIAVPPLILQCWRARYQNPDITHRASDAERHILARLTTRGPMLPEQLAAGLLHSSRTIHSALLRLYAMQLIEFTFINRRFHITAI